MIKAETILPMNEIAQMGAMKLAKMYGRENPLFRVMQAIAEVAGDGRAAILHGAIRFPEWKNEYRDASIVMKAWGLEMQNIYDLPALHVAGSAACPIAPENESFRMFMSMFRYKEAFRNSPELLKEVEKQLAKRPGINRELLGLSEKSIQNNGLCRQDAERHTDLVTSWLKIDLDAPLPGGLYNKLLAAGSDVAADIVCFPKTHLNHLTPQIAVDSKLKPVGKNIFEVTVDVQKLFELINKDAIEGGNGLAAEQYLREYLGAEKFKKLGVNGADFIEWAKLRNQVEVNAASERGENVKPIPFHGLTMIGMQGPRKSASNETPAAYLWQVSNKGVPLELDFEKDGKIYKGLHMAPFIEFEQRGFYPTKAAENLIKEGSNFDSLLAINLREIERRGLAYFTYKLADNWQENEFIRMKDTNNVSLEDLIDNGVIEITPVKYPGFLGKSAQGIFSGNLTRGGEAGDINNDAAKETASQALEKELGYLPIATDILVQKQVKNSLDLIRKNLEVHGINIIFLPS